jgi:hypothetical protein
MLYYGVFFLFFGFSTLFWFVRCRAFGLQKKKRGEYIKNIKTIVYNYSCRTLLFIVVLTIGILIRSGLEY